jgi:hypothetical protein
MLSRIFARVILMSAGLGCGCSPNPGDPAAGRGDANLRCAAMISAADRLMTSGKVASDPVVMQHGLIAAMTYLNAYAIPKRLEEKAGFAAVDAERTRIMATMQPAQIVRKAKTCIERVSAR